MKKKIIAWENWSEIEKELTEDSIFIDDIKPEMNEDDFSGKGMQADFFMGPMLSDIRSPVIQTPFGNVSSESKLKPSDRWDCWMGYTNFGITQDVQETIQEIEGVDALKVMSRYSFCIGVGKMFKSIDVKKDIHNAVCK
jgi:hypothetical protein